MSITVAFPVDMAVRVEAASTSFNRFVVAVALYAVLFTRAAAAFTLKSSGCAPKVFYSTFFTYIDV